MKKFLCCGLFCLIAIVFMACTSQNPQENAYIGKYLPVQGVVDSIVYTLDEIPSDEFVNSSIELATGGKGKITFEGESVDIKWSISDEKIHLVYGTNEVLATAGEDTLTIDNISNAGKTVTYAKEGTEAYTDKERYLSDKDKALIGKWQSNSVKDDQNNDKSASIDQTSFEIEFKTDHTAVISVKGVCSEVTNTWSTMSGENVLNEWYISSTKDSIIWQLVDDKLSVHYTTGDGEKYIYICDKQ